MKKTIIICLMVLMAGVSLSAQISAVDGKIRIGEPFNGRNWDIQINGFNGFKWNGFHFELDRYTFMVMSGNFEMDFSDPADASRPVEADRYNSIRVMRVYTYNEYPRIPYDDLPDFDGFMRVAPKQLSETAKSETPIAQIALLVNGVQKLSRRVAENAAELAAIEQVAPIAQSDGAHIVSFRSNGDSSDFELKLDPNSDNRLVITDLSGNIVYSGMCRENIVTVESGSQSQGIKIAFLLSNGKVVDSKQIVL